MTTDKETEFEHTFTEDEIRKHWSPYYLSYFVDILNGDYDITEAREDLFGLIEQGILTKESL